VLPTKDGKFGCAAFTTATEQKSSRRQLGLQTAKHLNFHPKCSADPVAPPTDSNRVLKKGASHPISRELIPAIMNLHERNWCLSPFFSTLLNGFS
jgi:hypothetical protein